MKLPRIPLVAIAGLALVGSGAFASIATVSGADHRDSPATTADKTADNTDLYAFRNGNNLVVVTGFFPLTAPADNASVMFNPAVSFALEVDRNGDLAPDATATFRYVNGSFFVDGLGSPFSFPVTPNSEAAVITQAGAIKAFAGLREDPFFFDLVGFQAFVADPTKVPVSGLRPAGAGAATDTFAGTNIFAIVVEIPITALTGGSSPDSGIIKVVGNIDRNGTPFDRVAIPAVNTCCTAANQKDLFGTNRNEAQDRAIFKPGVLNTIVTLRAAVDALFGTPQNGGPLGNLTSEQVADALLPYIVTIDFSKPVQFPNGRRLQDDVIDAALGLVLNRGGAAGVSDGVNGNDRAFLSSFPYLAEPFRLQGSVPSGGGSGNLGGAVAPLGTSQAIQPAAPAQQPAAVAPAGPSAAAPTVRPPSTGDAGMLSQSEMWTASAGLFVLALVLGGAGLFNAAKGRRN